MSTIEVTVPDIGGSTDVEVIEVLVQPGDVIAEEDSIIVLESDKATMEVPSPQAGTVKEVKVKVGDTVNEGDLVLLLEAGETASSGDAPVVAEEDASGAGSKPVAAAAPAPAAGSGEAVAGGTRIETVTVPDIGGSTDVPVIELCVQPGDVVAEEDSLIVLESDKATMEVPSPVAGKIVKLLVNVDDKVNEGTPIAEIEVQGAGTSAAVAAPAEHATPAAAPAPQAAAPASGAAVASAASAPAAPTASDADKEAVANASAKKVHAGPAVRKLAREFGVDLTQVKGSGPRGRILKEDVQAFVKAGMQKLQSGTAPVTGGVGLPTVKLPDFSQFGKIERRAMTKIHQVTADNMSRSWLTVPHVTQFDEADITELEAFRKAQKAAAEKRGTKLTPLPFLLKACAYALKTLPQFNVSLDMEKREVIQKHYVHIGVAVDTPHGLMVPVIRDVDQKSLWELAEETLELAAKAKDKKIKPNEMQGGCFTISSLGSIGGTAFTPIVNTPEVAILGVSKASMKPVWNGKDFEPRLMLPLSLSYDHRAINGADAARFTALLGQLLGDIRNLLL
ncbi:MAG: dihydrolipoyllysine-residue acetyltransferase [Gammaproteobacteria bacterium]|nr:MAG: dihydrolipoyllysine-residue acetyltransferase [Gammaproteobacteria bacterium]